MYYFNRSINSSTSSSVVAQEMTKRSVVSFSPRMPQSSNDTPFSRRLSTTSLRQHKELLVRWRVYRYAVALLHKSLADSLHQCHSMLTNTLIQIIFSKIYTKKLPMAVGDYTGIHFVLLRVVNFAPIPKRVHELSYDYSYMLNRFLKRNVGIFGTGLMV